MLWRAGLLPDLLAPHCRARISEWVSKELSPWTGCLRDVGVVSARLQQLNREVPEIGLFEIRGRGVRLVSKPGGFPTAQSQERAQGYLCHLTEALSLSGRGIDTLVAVYLRDGVGDGAGVPLFSFQKPRGHASILLPDVDFFCDRYYRSRKYIDTIPYSSKANTAAFVGATSGSGLQWINAEQARTLAWPPRLRSFAYFRGNPRVSFDLPAIVQCDSAETAQILRSRGCGAGREGARESWRRQFHGRFIISMDGNGATCSRVAIALKSRCALMKYDSDSILYYFHGLEPGRHYIPIAADADVEKILDLEAGGTSFAAVAEAGRQFAQTMLGRVAVLAYTCLLLETYAGAVFPGG